MDFQRRRNPADLSRPKPNPRLFGNVGSVPPNPGKPSMMAVPKVTIELEEGTILPGGIPLASLFSGVKPGTEVKPVAQSVPVKRPIPGKRPAGPVIRKAVDPDDPKMLASIELKEEARRQGILDGLAAAVAEQKEKDQALDNEYAAIVKPLVPIRSRCGNKACKNSAIPGSDYCSRECMSTETYKVQQPVKTFIPVKPVQVKPADELSSWASQATVKSQPMTSRIQDIVSTHDTFKQIGHTVCKQCGMMDDTLQMIRCINPKPVEMPTPIVNKTVTITKEADPVLTANQLEAFKTYPERCAPPIKKTQPTGVPTSFNPMRVKSQGGVGSHLAILALAGTGKTFTVIEGGRRIMGSRTEGVVGSDQQELIWEKMCEGSKPNNIHYTAFNKAIATHLETIIPANCTASTIHSIGYRAIMASGGRCKFEKRKINFILHDGWDEDHFKNFPGLCSLVEQVAGLIKLNLLDWTFQTTDVYTTVAALQAKYGFEASDKNLAALLEVLPYVMSECFYRDHIMDHDDMVWWPNVKPEIRLPKYDLIVVDESQDMGKAQQGMIIQCGRRIITVGDKNQAIYGFAGADTHAMDSLITTLKATPEGCQELELTKTRRCGKAIVRECQGLVPTFEALDDAPEGEVIYNKEEEGLGHIGESDMVVCRTNAPLISECLRFLREGKRARMQGRDIGDDLIEMVERFKCDYTADMLDKVDAFWNVEAEKLSKRKFGGEGALIVLEDKIESIKAFSQGTTFCQEIVDRIKKLFDDKNKVGTLFTSIHRAKGLEADTVVFWRHNECPHPMAKSEDAVEQEYHLRYVAMSRAKHRLFMTQAKPKNKSVDSEY